ncbi:MAG: hypothetical protein SFV22_14140, partial [Saprospiraceae bacterium]|nr:hypothetical protein [Saprospiraceae bacterium]
MMNNVWRLCRPDSSPCLPNSLLLLLLCCSAAIVRGQGTVRTALNHHIQYIQAGSRQVESMAASIGELYPEVLKASQGKGRERITYRCPYMEETYYRLQAQTKSGAQGQQLLPASEAFQTALEALAHQCQALDTYFKLETYKTDHYAGALALLQEIPERVAVFSQSQQNYETQIARISPGKTKTGPYAVAEGQLRRIMTLHRDMMAGLQYNFNEALHTGWPQKEILAHISRMQDALEEIASNKPKLNYPASAYYQSSLGCAAEFLESQRNYVDAYTIQAQETDQHNNDYYRQCLNYYNNCLVSFFNQFTDAAAADGWTMVHMPPVVPVFACKTIAVPPDKSIRLFVDAEVPALSVSPQLQPLAANTAAALNTCVEFANECARKNNFLLMALRNNGIHYHPYPAKSALYFNYETHQLPRSLLAELERQLRHIPAAYRPSLLLRAQQLMDISVEMDGMRQWLTDFSNDKKRQAEGWTPVENIRDRYVTLFALFDQKIAQLYADIVRIYAAYPTGPAAGADSWQRSYEALTRVVQADKTLCIAARQQVAPNAPAPVLPHEPVETAAVKAIQDEFIHMKGIEKLGRYNGLCPYTPYEDIGADSRRLAEFARAPERRQPGDFIYLYNEIVSDYNRFVELSGRPFLKNTRLMDRFQVEPPPDSRPNTAPVVP